jgi:hypothetical protein
MLMSGLAYATGEPPLENLPQVDVLVGVEVPVHINAPVHIESPVDVATPVDINAPVSIHDGGTQIRTDVPRQVPDTTIFYSPNYGQCMRSLGFQFATDRMSTFLGIPLRRDGACDLWLAANEAQENGHILLSYGFMCQIRNIQRVWGRERCARMTEQAIVWLELALKPPEEGSETQSEDEGSLTAAGQLLAVVEIEELEKELKETKETVTRQQTVLERLEQELMASKEQRRKVYRETQSFEDAKQKDLDDFLKTLEQRKGNK